MARSSTAQPLAAPSEARGGSYQRHRPEQTILYKTLQAHWRTFLAEVGNHDSGSTLPRFVIEEIEAFLKCGILAHGFVRVSCDGCGTNRVVALSCKRRGFCPSCVGRRMCDFAAHFVDNIAPRTPIRQWVLSVPHGLRFRMAFGPTTTSLVLRIFVQVISSWMRRRARTLRIKGRLETGAVTAIQRFGSAANLNLHFHTLVIDGVYQDTSSGPVFHPVPAPDEQDVARIAAVVWRKVTQKLARLDGKQGVDGTDCIARDEPLLAALASASVAGLIATGHRRGARVLRLGHGPSATTATLTGKQCATVEGFNVHAGVRVAADDREGLERLARYLSRPPIANNRLEQLSDGRLALRLKRPFRDGTEVIVFTPGELIEKLVLLVPRPRKHLTIFHGVLAPASRLRPLIVRRPTTDESAGETPKDETPRRARHRWSDLLRRVWAVDVLRCGSCGGRMRIIAALMDAPSAARFLRHLGLPAAAPVTAPPRGPPQARLAGETPANDLWADPPAHEDLPA